MATINGTNRADFLEGTVDTDFISGRQNRDVLLGLEGDDTLNGGTGNDTLDGGDGDDDLLGQGGRDKLIGSSGNDLLDGGVGRDTIDYRNLGEAITLKAAGAINKGSLGVDRILNIEIIIGATGQANSIDGSTGTSSSTSFDINLKNERLKVKGIPGLNNVAFNIKNFINVIGTSQNDKITGSSDDNVIEGGAGADTFKGSEGDDTIAGNDLAGVDDGNKDTVKYNGLGTGITLLPTGIVKKGTLGTDELIRVETIIGEAGRLNAIDASDNSSTSLDINLRAKTLVVDINDGSILERTVINFVNVIGGSSSDSIVDNNSNNLLEGGDGTDTIKSSRGNDTLSGDGGNDLITADFGQDVLTGGSGNDTFVLGANGNIFFDRAGDFDFAEITDFQSNQDRIQLTGIANLYSSTSSGSKSFISVDTNRNSVFDNNDELIASISGSFNFANDVIFV